MIQPVSPSEVLMKTFVHPLKKEDLATFCESNQSDLNDPLIPSILLGIQGKTGMKLPLVPPEPSSSDARVAVLPIIEVFGPQAVVWPDQGSIEAELFSILRNVVATNSFLSAKDLNESLIQGFEWGPTDALTTLWPEYVPPASSSNAVHEPGKQIAP